MINLIQKITFDNLCNPIRNVIVISGKEIVERKGKMQKIEYLQNEKNFLDQIKSIFLKCAFW